MKAKLKIVANFIVLIGVFFYLVIAMSYSARQSKEVEISELRVILRDSATYNFVTVPQIKKWVDESAINYLGVKANEFNTRKLNAIFKDKYFIKNAHSYVDLSGNLTVSITQRVPIIRFSLVNGYNFYLTSDNYILPLQSSFAHHIPVVTGSLDLPFEQGYVGRFETQVKNNQKKLPKNYVFFTKLVNFVQFISDDKFWDAQIVQFNIVKSLQSADHELDSVSNRVITSANYLVEMVPRAGDYTIMLGELDNFRSKLSNLTRFYSEAMPFEGWNNTRYVNLMYENQIVVTNK